MMLLERYKISLLAAAGTRPSLVRVGTLSWTPAVSVPPNETATFWDCHLTIKPQERIIDVDRHADAPTYL